MSITENIGRIRDLLPPAVKLIAVSKLHGIRDIMEAYDTGHRHFGENRVQELMTKQPLLPRDIQWHFIGHLQSNKVKYIAPFISLIQSVDSLKLLAEIDKQADRYKRIIPCLLQFHIAREETKFGLSCEEVEDLLTSPDYRAFKHISIHGVMGMASLIDDRDKIREEFRGLKAIFNDLKKKYFIDKPAFREISMGMSGDFGIAIEEGSTMVRLGTVIFGETHPSSLTDY
jgi:pyridoxal phosphate enzyme (YggS family)